VKQSHHQALLSFTAALSLLAGCSASVESGETLGSEQQELAACAEQPLSVAAATASSEQNGGYFAASKAVDFRTDTRWSSAPGQAAPQWLRLDFGQRRFVSSLSINWETAFAPSYDIQASDDGVNWATLRSVVSTQAGVQTVPGLDATARYVRILARTLSGYGNVSIIELTAFGDTSASCNATAATCGQTTRLAPTASQATSTEFSYTPASAAVDGVYNTRWSSAYSDDQALALDLGSVARIDQVRLTWQTAYAAKYAIETAPAMTGPWTVAVQNNAGHGGVETLNVGASARFVRFHGIQRATGYGYSLWEMDVLGSKATNCAPNLLTTGWDPNTTANNIGAPSGVSVPGLYSIDQTVQNRIDFTQSGQYCPVGGGGWVSFTQHVTVPSAGNSYHLQLDIPRNDGSLALVVASATLNGVAGSNYLPMPTTDTSGNAAASLYNTGKIEADFATTLSAGQQVDLTVRFSILGVNIPNTNCGARIQSYTLGGATLTRTN
jgi:hypothetical protein